MTVLPNSGTNFRVLLSVFTRPFFLQQSLPAGSNFSDILECKYLIVLANQVLKLPNPCHLSSFVVQIIWILRVGKGGFSLWSCHTDTFHTGLWHFVNATLTIRDEVSSRSILSKWIRGPLRGKNGECHSKCPQGNMFSRLDTVIPWIDDRTQIISLLCFLLIRSC